MVLTKHFLENVELINPFLALLLLEAHWLVRISSSLSFFLLNLASFQLEKRITPLCLHLAGTCPSEVLSSARSGSTCGSGCLGMNYALFPIGPGIVMLLACTPLPLYCSLHHPVCVLLSDSAPLN